MEARAKVLLLVVVQLCCNVQWTTAWIVDGRIQTIPGRSFGAKKNRDLVFNEYQKTLIIMKGDEGGKKAVLGVTFAQRDPYLLQINNTGVPKTWQLRVTRRPGEGWEQALGDSNEDVDLKTEIRFFAWRLWVDVRKMTNTNPRVACRAKVIVKGFEVVPKGRVTLYLETGYDWLEFPFADAGTYPVERAFVDGVIEGGGEYSKRVGELKAEVNKYEPVTKENMRKLHMKYWSTLNRVDPKTGLPNPLKP